MSPIADLADNAGATPMAIAIVGIGTLFPGSDNAKDFWRDIISGRDCITDIPRSHWIVEDHYHPDPSIPDKTYGKRGAFLSPVKFDPVEFRIPPTNLPSTDTSQLLGLKVAKQVLEDAVQGPLGAIARHRTSVILGVASGLELLGEMNSRIQRPIWSKALEESGLPNDRISEICDRIANKYTPWKESTFPGLLGNVVAGRIASHFDLGGTNCTVDAACASSFSAISMAVNELRLGLADLVISGGVDTTNGPFLFTCFSKTPALSPTGDCRPFSDSADGMIIGEGIGMVALKRLEDAQRDGNRIYAVLKGIGTSSDGAGQSVFAPLREGQERALRRCYDMAGYAPETVTLVEAHGTGTTTGDRVEFEALSRVLDENASEKRQWCALGSIKSQIGHTKSAAGVAGLIKVVMALHNKVLPPTIKVTRPDPGMDLPNSPFYLNTRARPWISPPDRPRRASVSAFGFGGTNFHLTLEAYTGQGKHGWRHRVMPSELILLSAANERDLIVRCRDVADQVHAKGILSFLARESQNAFDSALTARIAFVACDEQDLEKKIHRGIDIVSGTADAIHSCPTGIHYSMAAPQRGSLAFLFPGQGSQYVGMGSDLAMHMAEAGKIWEMAATVPMEKGSRLHDIVFPYPVFTKREEEHQNRILKLGQWAQPAVCTMSLSILALLKQLGITPNCVGGPGWGEVTALHAAGMLEAYDLIVLAKKRGAFKAGNYSSGQYGAYLIGLPLVRPDRPIYSSRYATAYPNDMAGIRQFLARKSDGPNRFLEVIEAMYAKGARTFVEVGPGSVLTEQVDQCLGHHPHLAIHTDRQGHNGITCFWNAVGRLAIHGVPMDLSQLWKDHAPVVDPRLHRESKYSVSLMGCNHARPYPPPAADLPQTKPKVTNIAAAETQPAPVESIKMENNAMKLKSKVKSDPSGNPTVTVPEQPSPASHTDDAHLAKGSQNYNPPENGNMAAWLNAFQELQRQTAVTHEAYQRNLTDSHMAYLKSAEASTRTLGSLMGSGPRNHHVTQSQPHPEVSRISTQVGHPPVPVADPPAKDLSFQPLTEKSSPEESEVGNAPSPQQIHAPFTVYKPADPPATIHNPDDPEGAEQDLKTLLFDVVSEKTGYPQEVLNMDMDLETDLGIDSIKRVEILSAITDQAPQMPEVDTVQLATLQTMGDVLTHMKQVAHNLVDEPPTMETTILAPVADPPSATGAVAEPTRFALRTVSAPHASPSAREGVHYGFCAITDDGSGIGQALVERLKGMNIEARVVADVPEYADSVIFLGGLRACPDLDSAMAVNREAFCAAQSVSRKFSSSGGFFATVQDTGGNFGLTGCEDIRAWLAGLPGLVKTAAIEWPYTKVKALDVERAGRSPEVLAQVICEELFEGGPEIEVGLYADGNRIRLESYPSALEHRYPRFDESSVIVVSGGGRGVTAAALTQLAQRFHPKIALLGRTVLEDEPDSCQGAFTEKDLKQALINETEGKGLPVMPARIDDAIRQVLANREIQSTLQALRAAGSEAEYFSADVRNGSAVGSVLEAVRRQWGPITGIVHGAGIINDKLISDKTLAMFDAVYDTKVRGLQSLLDATGDDPLEMICLFSSVAARLGNIGQCDYAMANEVLNKVAQAQSRRRRHACVVKSINWGPWEGGMVSEPLKARFAQLGVPLIDVDSGARLFVDEIQAAPSDAVEVVIIHTPDKTTATKMGSGQ